MGNKVELRQALRETIRNKPRDLLVEKMQEEFHEQRKFIRQKTKKNIQKVQTENNLTCSKKQKKVPEYKTDLIL